MTPLRIHAALAVCLAAAYAADTPQIVKGVQDRYNHAKTLRVKFHETYAVPGRPKQSESGTLTLRKPGRMRWDYTIPAGKLFISDGKDVYLYNPDTKRVEKMKLKESEDMRAPLAFLLGKLDFKREFRDITVQPAGANYEIAARAKNDKLPYESVRMLVTPSYEILNLEVTGQDKSVLAFDFADEAINVAVNDSMFRFEVPPGAVLVQPESGD